MTEGPEPKPLTDRQAEVYRILVAFRDREGRSPSWVEMIALLGVSGPRPVRQHIDALERKGWIRRDPEKRQARKSGGIEFLRPASEAIGPNEKAVAAVRAMMLLSRMFPYRAEAELDRQLRQVAEEALAG